MNTFTTPPTLTMIFMNDCEFCEQAKPEFDKLRAVLAPKGWRLQRLNVDEHEFNVPITYLPSFHLALPKKNYMTNGKELDEKFKSAADVDGLTTWLTTVVNDYARTT